MLRHGTRAVDAGGAVGVSTPGWGPPNGPAGGLLAQTAAVAGQSRHFQVILRDDPLAGCLRGLNTSQGVSVLVGP